jgi:hypothetical protein
VTGVVRSVPAGGDLQAALNAAQPGDAIELATGATFTGNFKVPAKVGSRKIWIRSSGYVGLAADKRIAPSDAAKMARIVTATTQPALWFEFAASNYYLTGIDVTTTWAVTTGTQYGLIELGRNVTTDQGATALSQLSQNIVFDRMYVHGAPTGNVRRGIALNSGATAVIDSYISDIHETGSDSQALCGWSGPGPFVIRNNHLEASGENVMFGGSDPSIKGVIPSDIEISGNRLYKPLAWKGLSPAWSVKNSLEFKNAQRVAVVGNTFENNWPGSQNGWSILITPRNQGGGCGTVNPDGSWTPLCGTRDITLRLNEGFGLHAAFNIMGQDGTFPGKPTFRTARVLIEHNLMWRMGYGGGFPNGSFLVNVGGAEHVKVRNNTFDGPGSFMYGTGQPPNSGAVAINNLVAGNGGVGGDAQGWGAPALNFYWPGINFSGNALWGPYPTTGGGVVSQYGTYKQPMNDFPTDRNAVQFVDPVNGDYHLAPGSPYQGKGADIDAINAATAQQP